MGPGPFVTGIGIAAAIQRIFIRIVNAALGVEMPKEEGGSGGGQQFSSNDGRANERGRTLTIKPGETVEPTENIDGLLSTVGAAGSAAEAKGFKEMGQEIDEAKKVVVKIHNTLENASQVKESYEKLNEAVKTVQEASESEPEDKKGGHPDTVVLDESAPRVSGGRSGTYTTTSQRLKVGNDTIERDKTVKSKTPLN